MLANPFSLMPPKRRSPTLAKDVKFDEIITAKDEMSGADIKALCTEAGLLALRERRMKVTQKDFEGAKDNVLQKKKQGIPDGIYL